MRPAGSHRETARRAKRKEGGSGGVGGLGVFGKYLLQSNSLLTCSEAECESKVAHPARRCEARKLLASQPDSAAVAVLQNKEGDAGSVEKASRRLPVPVPLGSSLALTLTHDWPRSKLSNLSNCVTSSQAWMERGEERKTLIMSVVCVFSLSLSWR